MEREKICAEGLRGVALCPWAIVKEECEPHQSILGHYEGSQLVVTNVRNEETVWKVYCNHSGQEKLVGYVWPYIDCDAPKTCPLLEGESTQHQKKNFWEKVKGLFQK